MMKSKVIAPVAWSLVLGVLMLGLAACGSKENEPKGSTPSSKSETSQSAAPAAAPAQTKINAAEFFTKADAEAVLGKPVNDPTIQGDGIYTSNVSYIATDFTGISLYVRAGTSPRTFEEAQAKSKSISDVDPVPVAGVGEKAYWAGGKLNQLNVLKNQNWLIISVFAGGEQSLDLTKKAAEKILPRVP
jgi:hypothetical protein